MLGAIGSLTTGRPRLVVVVWLLAMVALAGMGKDLESKISTKPIFVEGSAAEREHQIAVREFGAEDALVLVLRGPRPAVDQQGRDLVRRFQTLPRQTLVISPWSARGSIEGLRPSPRSAAILVSAEQESDAANSDTVPLVRRIVRNTVHDPVSVSIAGGPAIIDSLRDSITRAASVGERLAIPALLIVLLLVCRAVLAAAMPVVIGALVLGATRGVLDLFSAAVPVDSIATGTAAMLGLALGVDYSLLVVSRFREEIDKGGDVEGAVRRTVSGTGRSILPAGGGLVLAMLASLELIPGTFIKSVALAVIAATVLSVLSAMLLAPAALTLLGHRLNRWSLPRRREGGSLVLAWSNRLSRRPGIALAMLFLLVLCSAWSFTLQTGIGSAALLPPDDPGRQAEEEVQRQLGPGWAAPFEITMTAAEDPVTTPRRLKALSAFQREVEEDPGVEAMAGFAGLERATDGLGSVERKLVAQERGAARLSRGLGGAEDGAVASSEGFARAADGAGQLAVAVGAARTGTGALADGLRSSADGSARLSGGLGEADEGSGKLTRATAEVSTGAGRLAAKVADARKESDEAASGSRTLENALRLGERSLDAAPLKATEDRLAAAWAALQGMAAGRGDPQYPTALAAVREANRELTGADFESEEGSDAGVVAEVEHALNQFNLGIYLAERQAKNGEEASAGIDKLAKASARLDRGLRRMLARSRDLSAGIARLSAGGEELSPGLERLTVGAERLLTGLGRIEDGAGGLAGGLSGGALRSQRLTGALGRLHAGVEGEQGSGALQEQSPGIFRSGYFYLAGLDGSRPEQRNQAGFLVNLAAGGTTARMLVVPSDGPATDAVAATRDRLTEDAAELSRETGDEVYVGGLPAGLADLNSALRDQTPLARIVLSLVTLLVLIPVTRSLTLSILAALLNLLTVSATFGLLSLLFNDSLLGGPGFVDTAVIPATVILTFGLAIDYEVFIFARIREEYVRTGSTATALAEGFAKTAYVISGAAVIMIVVFLAFSVSPLANLRNLGVAMAIGVFIDAFVIRFVLLPAMMKALGDRCWWLPRWIERILPGESPARTAAG